MRQGLEHLCKRAWPRTNLEHKVLILQVGQCGYPPADIRVAQKVLPKALLGSRGSGRSALSCRGLHERSLDPGPGARGDVKYGESVF